MRPVPFVFSGLDDDEEDRWDGGGSGGSSGGGPGGMGGRVLGIVGGGARRCWSGRGLVDWGSSPSSSEEV